jgi:hypothetical protein
VAGEERMKFVEQAQVDFTDYKLVGDAQWEASEGWLVLRIPLAGRKGDDDNG